MAVRKKIGIIGAGFTGTALAATLLRLSKVPLDIILCDKSGRFGSGPAYSTPFSHHLLNVRAHDMSAFSDEPEHFVNWLSAHPDKRMYCSKTQPLADQFVPRCYYYDYLQRLLSEANATLVADEVVDIDVSAKGAALVFKKQANIEVDQVVLALGNNPPDNFPFPVAADIHRIDHPWDYSAVSAIGKQDPVLIVGTGLSMIDAVLTLFYQQHQGKIYAVSRHGLLPLPHTDTKSSYAMETAWLTGDMREMTKSLRRLCEQVLSQAGDWRSMINALRAHIPEVWQRASVLEKRRFLRHLLPYWSCHRHRVHADIMTILEKLMADQQLIVMSGRIRAVQDGKGIVTLRDTQAVAEVPVSWLINCMGPSQQMLANQQPLLQALHKRQQLAFDPLGLGLAIGPNYELQQAGGDFSKRIYAIGASTRGKFWEINAVPDIRRQIFDLAGHLLA